MEVLKGKSSAYNPFLGFGIISNSLSRIPFKSRLNSLLNSRFLPNPKFETDYSLQISQIISSLSEAILEILFALSREYQPLLLPSKEEMKRVLSVRPKKFFRRCYRVFLGNASLRDEGLRTELFSLVDEVFDLIVRSFPGTEVWRSAWKTSKSAFSIYPSPFNSVSLLASSILIVNYAKPIEIKSLRMISHITGDR